MESGIQQRAIVRLSSAVGALLLLLAIGTIGYHLIEDMNLIDAMYMAVITISTVGFSEVQQLSPNGRLFTMVLIIGGGGIAAYSLSAAAEFFLSGEWRVHLEKRRQQQQLAQLNHHTIVCGYGRMGQHIVDELQAQALPFVVIEPNGERVAKLRDINALVLQGDAAVEADLYTAGIERARSLVSMASSDAENVYIVLTARSLRPDLLIISRANNDVSESKLLRAGADRVILPYRISGRRVVTLLVRPEVADFLDELSHTNELELLLDQVHLEAGSPLVNQTLDEANLRGNLGVTVLACRLPNENINTNPDADTRLQPGAQLIVLATRDQLSKLREMAQGNTLA